MLLILHLHRLDPRLQFLEIIIIEVPIDHIILITLEKNFDQILLLLREISTTLILIKNNSNFNKKQLTKIILDKNKVIADLEEKAYGKGIYPPNPQQFSYLDNILDNNTTHQNITIHKEHFNSVPKYISPLV